MPKSTKHRTALAKRLDRQSREADARQSGKGGQETTQERNERLQRIREAGRRLKGTRRPKGKNRQ